MRKIRTKLLVGIVSIATAICLILGGMALLALASTANNGTETAVTVAYEGYSNSVAKSIEIYKMGAEEVAKSDAITDNRLSMDQKRATLADLAEKYGFVDISVSDQYGTTYNDTDISTREYFQRAIEGETYISSPVIRMTDDSVILFVSTPITNSTGFKGIIYCALNYDVFSSMVGDVAIGQNGYGFITDKEGTVIAHPDSSLVDSFTSFIKNAETDPARYSDLASMTQSMMAGETGFVKLAYDGVDKDIAYGPIDGTDGWSLGVSADEDEMLAVVNYMVIIVIIISSVAIGLSIVFAFIFARPIALSVSSVSDRLKLLSQGDLSSPVPKSNLKDEIGQLALSLDQTIAELNLYINDIASVLGDISADNLDIHSNQQYLGDFAPIKSSLEDIVESLNHTMTQLSQTADQVSSGAEQVSGGAQALSQGATEQASSIEELSATITEISAHVKQTAENASNASDLVSQTGAEAENSSDKMRTMVAAMSEISNFSNEIDKIIKTIEDIAFQTNILALNAAVEAARAGEAGKGFAVVADEVRNLASKSADAAKNTTDLIQGTINAVDNGNKIAEDTATALSHVVQGVSEITKLVSSIAEASVEQASSIIQVTQGLDQVSAVVQTNSATSEESAAASEELSGQAYVLNEMVSKFKLKS